MTQAKLLSGVPSINKAVFWKIRFHAHDPASVIEMPDGRTTLILRDVELARAKTDARADEVFVYEDFTPEGGLSGDREVRAAQSTAECLVRAGVTEVVGDRSVPWVVVDELLARGIEVTCDYDLGVIGRRMKSDEEVEHLRRAQRATEDVIEWACTTIARAKALSSGELEDPEASGEALTTERMRRRIESRLMDAGFLSEHSIVACGAVGADCHHGGAGALRTGEPIIVDVFPRDLETGYHGDCTRMVAHGDVPDVVVKMHDTVVRAKKASIEATRAGATGEDVHRAVIGVIEGAGYAMGFPPEGAAAGFCSMPHGTGHGLGLDLKEPPLLDLGGPELLAGDAVTVEPGLYMLGVGGMRLEDLLIVRAGGCENLNTLGEGLDWR
ncbi:MAG: Xaa-Pro peptidase family protein [Phycisphaerales bacterium]